MNGFVLQSISGIRRHIETCGNKEHLYGPKSVFKQEKKKKGILGMRLLTKEGRCYAVVWIKVKKHRKQ